MQPNPDAETSNPVLPSFRFCIKSPSPTLLESQRLDSNGAPTDSVANMDVSANHKACGQRRVVRRTPGQHLIFARGQVPRVLLFIKGLQHAVIDRNRNGLRFAGSERDSLPPDKPLEGFVWTRRKPRIDLSNLGAASLAGVLDSEARSLGGCIDRQAGVCVGGVRQTEAEGKQWLLILCFIPLVANLRPLIVVDSITSVSRSIRSRRTVVGNISSAYLALGRNVRRIRMRKIRFAFRERQRELARRIDVSNQHICHRLVSGTSGEPSLDYARYF